MVPVYEGFVLNHALQVSDIAGLKITEILEEELKKKYIFSYFSSVGFESKDQIEYA